MAVATIVIPTYNRAKLLERAMKSVLNQTFTDFRLCICDNASPDETPEMVRRYQATDPRIEYYRHPENKGLLGNWNFGLLQVDSPFFSVLCDDDLILPTFLTSALALHQRFPDVRYVAGAALVASHDGIFKDVAPSANVRYGYYAAPDGFQAITDVLQHPSTPAILFRREVLDDYAQLDLRTGGLGDLDLFLKISLRYPIVLDPEVWAIYVHSAQSTSFNNALSNLWIGLPSMVANLEAIPLQTEKQRQMRTRACNFYFSRIVRLSVDASVAALRQGNFKEAKAAGQFAVELARARKDSRELLSKSLTEGRVALDRRARGHGGRRWQPLARALNSLLPAVAVSTPRSEAEQFIEEAERHLAYMAQL